MKNYTGKGKTIDAAIQEAAQSAVGSQGPDSLISFSVNEIRGVHGGIAGLHQIEVDITLAEVTSSQLCGDASQYRAYQSNEIVTIVSYGLHPSSGYSVSLELSPIDIYPPQHTLVHREPTGPAATVVTPFVVSASFKAPEIVKEVEVRDGKGIRKITVEQILLPSEENLKALATRAAHNILEDRQGSDYYNDPNELANYLESLLSISKQDSKKLSKAIIEDRKGANFYADEKILAEFLLEGLSKRKITGEVV